MVMINDILKKEFHKGSIIPKALKKGSRIKLKHYSTFEPINNVIGNIEGNNIIMELPLKLLNNNILIGDSIVCIFMHEEVEHVLSGEVVRITIQHPQKMTVKIESVEKYKNIRVHNRYSVSLSANVEEVNSKQVHFAVVKNISLSGVSFTCNVEFEENKDFVINIAMSKDIMLTFHGRGVRVRKVMNYYEYGVIQTSIDEFNMEVLEKYIETLQEEEKCMFL